jgi:hypothetical protein
VVVAAPPGVVVVFAVALDPPALVVVPVEVVAAAPPAGAVEVLLLPPPDGTATVVFDVWVVVLELPGVTTTVGLEGAGVEGAGLTTVLLTSFLGGGLSLSAPLHPAKAPANARAPAASVSLSVSLILFLSPIGPLIEVAAVENWWVGYHGNILTMRAACFVQEQETRNRSMSMGSSKAILMPRSRNNGHEVARTEPRPPMVRTKDRGSRTKPRLGRSLALPACDPAVS